MMSWFDGGETASHRDSMALSNVKGLLNAPGANNCFLNSAVQVLWHLDVFRRSFRHFSDHVCMGANSCIFCALKVIFTQFQYSDQEALPPDALRSALAETFSNEQRFQLGQMDDAAECLENILSRVHFHLTGSENCDMCDSRLCITHQKFAMTLLEQTACQCGATSEPFPFTQIVYYVSTSALISQISDQFYMHRIESYGFSEILKSAASAGDTRRCSSGCGKTARIRRTLMNTPDVLCLGLVWDSDQPSAHCISQVVSSISTSVYISQLFDSVLDKRWLEHSVHHLVGVVCYYGKHYSTFFCRPRHKMWIYFDDEMIKPIGSEWCDVQEKLILGHFQPLLLLYANPSALPIVATPASSSQAVCIDVMQGKGFPSEKLGDSLRHNALGGYSSSRRSVTPGPYSVGSSVAVQPPGAVVRRHPSFMSAVSGKVDNGNTNNIIMSCGGLAKPSAGLEPCPHTSAYAGTEGVIPGSTDPVHDEVVLLQNKVNTTWSDRRSNPEVCGYPQQTLASFHASHRSDYRSLGRSRHMVPPSVPPPPPPGERLTTNSQQTYSYPQRPIPDPMHGQSRFYVKTDVPQVASTARLHVDVAGSGRLTDTQLPVSASSPLLTTSTSELPATSQQDLGYLCQQCPGITLQVQDRKVGLDYWTFVTKATSSSVHVSCHNDLAVSQISTQDSTSCIDSMPSVTPGAIPDRRMVASRLSGSERHRTCLPNIQSNKGNESSSMSGDVASQENFSSHQDSAIGSDISDSSSSPQKPLSLPPTVDNACPKSEPLQHLGRGNCLDMCMKADGLMHQAGVEESKGQISDALYLCDSALSCLHSAIKQGCMDKELMGQVDKRLHEYIVQSKRLHVRVAQQHDSAVSSGSECSTEKLGGVLKGSTHLLTGDLMRFDSPHEHSRNMRKAEILDLYRLSDKVDYTTPASRKLEKTSVSVEEVSAPGLYHTMHTTRVQRPGGSKIVAATRVGSIQNHGGEPVCSSIAPGVTENCVASTSCDKHSPASCARPPSPSSITQNPVLAYRRPDNRYTDIYKTYLNRGSSGLRNTSSSSSLSGSCASQTAMASSTDITPNNLSSPASLSGTIGSSSFSTESTLAGNQAANPRTKLALKPPQQTSQRSFTCSPCLPHKHSEQLPSVHSNDMVQSLNENSISHSRTNSQDSSHTVQGDCHPADDSAPHLSISSNTFESHQQPPLGHLPPHELALPSSQGDARFADATTKDRSSAKEKPKPLPKPHHLRRPPEELLSSTSASVTSDPSLPRSALPADFPTPYHMLDTKLDICAFSVASDASTVSSSNYGSLPRRLGHSSQQPKKSLLKPRKKKSVSPALAMRKSVTFSEDIHLIAGEKDGEQCQDIERVLDNNIVQETKSQSSSSSSSTSAVRRSSPRKHQPETSVKHGRGGGKSARHLLSQSKSRDDTCVDYSAGYNSDYEASDSDPETGSKESTKILCSLCRKRYCSPDQIFCPACFMPRFRLTVS